MSRLLDRLVTRLSPEQTYPGASNAATVVSQWGVGGDCEKVGEGFASYVADGFKSNSVVFSLVMARMRLFSQARFKWQLLSDESLYGNPDLLLLEEPWVNGTTDDLLRRMLQDADLGGNAFVRRAEPTRLERLRPDWVRIVSGVLEDGSREPVGVLYNRDGDPQWTNADAYPASEVAHWAPIPDPLACWRGMSWLTPVIREINADVAMSSHREAFFERGATPGMIMKYKERLEDGAAEKIARRVQSMIGGPRNAYKTMVLDEGADLTLLGSNFQEMAFDALQAAGENRIASAGGVPPIIVGFKEGLDAATYSNYAMAMRAFAGTTMADLWQSASASLQTLMPVPPGSRLWYDKSGIDAIQESLKDRAEANQITAETMVSLINAGYLPESVTHAGVAGDMSLLVHSGKIPTTLYQDGTDPATGGNA